MSRLNPLSAAGVEWREAAIRDIHNRQIHRDQKISVYQGLGQSRGRVVAGEYGVIWGDDEMFCNYIVVMVAQL